MIKQLLSKDLKEYLAASSDKKRVLLDVRTEEEWTQLGKPDGEKLGLKTYFLTIQDDNFVQEFKNLSISQDTEILAMCAAGERSQVVSELLTKENYKCVNISDGFTGWMTWDLPNL
tara:strand:- start:665 stop:1012 length:348 start_codon:yes stop_codon:yes gene_type:complete